MIPIGLVHVIEHKSEPTKEEILKILARVNCRKEDTSHAVNDTTNSDDGEETSDDEELARVFDDITLAEDE